MYVGEEHAAKGHTKAPLLIRLISLKCQRATLLLHSQCHQANSKISLRNHSAPCLLWYSETFLFHIKTISLIFKVHNSLSPPFLHHELPLLSLKFLTLSMLLLHICHPLQPRSVSFSALTDSKPYPSCKVWRDQVLPPL